MCAQQLCSIYGCAAPLSGYEAVCKAPMLSIEQLRNPWTQSWKEALLVFLRQYPPLGSSYNHNYAVNSSRNESVLAWLGSMLSLLLQHVQVYFLLPGCAILDFPDDIHS